MELNLAPTTNKAGRNVKLNKKKVKGSWRKRRREEVIHKARSEKRLRPSGKQLQREKARKIQSDEFASGIEARGTEQGERVERRGGNTKPIQKSAVNISKAKGHRNEVGEKELAEKQKSVKFSDRLEKGERNSEIDQGKKPWNRPSAVKDISTDEKNPEAVKTALSVIGKYPGNENATKDETVKDSIADKASDKSKKGSEDETFGATSFEDTGLYRSVARHVVHRMGLQLPTRVQEKVLSVMLNLEDGQQSVDVLIRSATGSGKTLAYLLPIAHYLLNRVRRVSRGDGSFAIILVPTRELAEQVEDVAEQLFRPWHWIVTGSVRGGESKHREKARLRKGIGVLVATPGRLLDHMRNTRSFEYRPCEFLVLDEADRLLDLGFEATIKEIIQILDKHPAHANGEKVRSNLLLSATLRADVEKLAEFSLEKPVEVTVGRTEAASKSAFAMPHQLRQHYCIVDQRHRLVTLTCFLRLRALKDVVKSAERIGDTHAGPCKIIVFFSTCDSVDFHYELLRRARVPKELHGEADQERKEKMVPLDIYRIHGNHSQADRVAALRGFRKNKRAVLLSTDVAARGLDLKGLTFSIQYDPPTGGQGEELEYLHRAGRTARIGEQGDALLFLLPSERAYVGKLESKGVSIAAISGSAAMAALYPKVNLAREESISYGTRLVTSALQEMFEDILKQDENLKRMAVAGFQAYCRAYATHAKEVRYFFHVRNLHLGHVARSFVLGDKPAEMSEMMAEIRAMKQAAEAGSSAKKKEGRSTKRKGDVARAIAEGEAQPYNDQTTALARRRREKGRGGEAFKELAMEFGS